MRKKALMGLLLAIPFLTTGCVEVIVAHYGYVYAPPPRVVVIQPRPVVYEVWEVVPAPRLELTWSNSGWATTTRTKTTTTTTTTIEPPHRHHR